MSDLYIVSRSGRDPNEIVAQIESRLSADQLACWRNLPTDAVGAIILIGMRDGISAAVDAIELAMLD